MELRRFFVAPTDVADDGTITVRGGEAEHIARVLRMKKGFKAIVCTGDGSEITAEITDISRDSVTMRRLAERKADRRDAHLTLYCGILKNKNLDFVVRHAVELGVDRIIPFCSSRTDETSFNAERGNKIALEAAKQCGSVFLSEVCEPLTFAQMTEQFGEYDAVYFCYENERRRPLAALRPEGKRFALVVGSEGGFTEEEVREAQNKGAVTVTLGRRILRAETADIVACAFALGAMGELDYD